MAATTATKPEPLHVIFGDGFTSKEIVNLSLQTGITALAGGGQTNAVQLNEQVSNITVCATNGDSVKLPVPPVNGSAVLFLKNNGAANLAVFPQASGTINGGSVNASVTVNAAAKQIFFSTNGVNWETML